MLKYMAPFYGMCDVTPTRQKKKRQKPESSKETTVVASPEGHSTNWKVKIEETIEAASSMYKPAPAELTAEDRLLELRTRLALDPSLIDNLDNVTNAHGSEPIMDGHGPTVKSSREVDFSVGISGSDQVLHPQQSTNRNADPLRPGAGSIQKGDSRDFSPSCLKTR